MINPHVFPRQYLSSLTSITNFSLDVTNRRGNEVTGLRKEVDSHFSLNLRLNGKLIPEKV